MVEASDITKQLYESERIASYNDFDTIYNRKEKISASEVFAKNGVPIEFQIIIIKITSSVFSKKEAEEYTLGFPFDYTSKNIDESDNKKYIRMHNSPIYYDGSIFDDKFIFRTKLFYNSFNNVIFLLEEMYKKGCLELYLQSIKEFFDISQDLGLWFDAWHKTHDTQKALKLYKHKNASKII